LRKINASKKETSDLLDDIVDDQGFEVLGDQVEDEPVGDVFERVRVLDRVARWFRYFRTKKSDLGSLEGL
jgi:hypothetical protein